MWKLLATFTLVSCFALAAPDSSDSCLLAEHEWLQNCAIADDCTSEASFCPCCRVYPDTEYTAACEVICGVQPAVRRAGAPRDSWRFHDFGDEQAEERERGPWFEQPSLSLVGDAAVVLGDCYNLDVSVHERSDGGQEACLVPPVTPRLFATDAHLTLNLSICASEPAPFHVHDPQPAALAAMLCFDECRVRNETQPVAPPRTIDHDALRIANCTQGCFASCVRPLASNCSSSCAPTNYSCFADCHRAATTCSVPIGRRDWRYMRSDPNVATCTDVHDGYRQCVSDCHGQCHADLLLSKRTVYDDINDWYNASCLPPLLVASDLAPPCVFGCEDNCTSFCNETVTAVLGPALGLGPALSNCTRNCTAGCAVSCFTEDAYYDYADGCRPPPL